MRVVVQSMVSVYKSFACTLVITLLIIAFRSSQFELTQGDANAGELGARKDHYLILTPSKRAPAFVPSPPPHSRGHGPLGPG